MVQSVKEITDTLNSFSYEAGQTMGKLEDARAIISNSWTGEVGDAFRSRLEKQVSGIDHTRRVIETVVAQIVRKG